MSDGQSQLDSFRLSPRDIASSTASIGQNKLVEQVVHPSHDTGSIDEVPKCSLADIDFLFPASWGNSEAYTRLRHLRSIEAAALHHQMKKYGLVNESECTAIRRIDALMEIQRRECFRMDGIQNTTHSHVYMYGKRNEVGEPIRLEYIRDRMWPPKEFALKNIPKAGPGRGGGRKRKIPEKTPAQLDEERLVMDVGKTCIDCATQTSPLWRQVDAIVDIPETLPDQIVIIPKEDICLMCYVQRSCGAKVKAQITKKKRDKTAKAKEEAKAKKNAMNAIPTPLPPTVEVSPVVDIIYDDYDDANSTGDEKRRKKSSKKSSKKKKKKSKRSSSSVPGSPNSPKASKHSPVEFPSPKNSVAPILDPLIIDEDTETPPPPPSTSRSSSRKDSKKRSREPGSPRTTPKTKSSKKLESSVPILPTETPREKELRAKGQYCPICNRTYEDDDASEFVCCDSCEMWVHSLCDPKLNAERMKELAEPDAKYIGPCCTSKRRR